MITHVVEMTRRPLRHAKFCTPGALAASILRPLVSAEKQCNASTALPLPPFTCGVSLKYVCIKSRMVAMTIRKPIALSRTLQSSNHQMSMNQSLLGFFFFFFFFFLAFLRVDDTYKTAMSDASNSRGGSSWL